MLRILTFIFLTFPIMSSAERHALIIGNQDYTSLTSLRNTKADAAAYSDALEDLGYQVALRTDLDLDDMEDAIDSFTSGINPGDQVVFVFSGHGWSDGATNFLLPTDAPKSGSARKIERSSISLKNGRNGILDTLKASGAELSVAIIDACRDNPFTPKAGTKSAGLSRGLARVEATQGSFVIYSAGEGQTALDRLPNDPSSQKLSVFTRYFVPQLKAGLPLEDAINEAQVQTAKAAQGVDHLQHPAYYDQALGKTCLGETCGVQQAALPVARQEPLKQSDFSPTPTPKPKSQEVAERFAIQTVTYLGQLSSKPIIFTGKPETLQVPSRSNNQQKDWTTGFSIHEVKSASPAPLKEGDLLLSVMGQPIKSRDDLDRQFKKHRGWSAGVWAEVYRKGKRENIRLNP